MKSKKYHGVLGNEASKNFLRLRRSTSPVILMCLQSRVNLAEKCEILFRLLTL